MTAGPCATSGSSSPGTTCQAAQAPELNSLSMYAVGSGTTLEYVQSLAGLDDGFEWWGGAVDGRYLVSYEAGDDHFDWTEGYRGRNQFLIGFQSVRLDPAPGAGRPGHRPGGLRGGRLQRNRMRSRVRQPAVLHSGIRQLHPGRLRDGHHADRAETSAWCFAAEPVAISPMASSPGGRPRASRSGRPRPTPCWRPTRSTWSTSCWPRTRQL